MKYVIDMGCPVDAYARVIVDATDKKELVAKLRELIANQAGDQVLEVEWGTADDYRLVGVTDENGKEALTTERLQAITDGE
jgi:hypothetical protein